MPVVIDCYNLLHADKPERFAALDETRLCHVLSRSQWRTQTVILVCDGVPKPLGFIESPVPGVEVRHSGAKFTADDVIAQIVEAESNRKSWLVVSDDRQVCKTAKRQRARTIGCTQFLHDLKIGESKSSADRTKPLDATQTLDDDETARWLREFGIR